MGEHRGLRNVVSSALRPRESLRPVRFRTLSYDSLRYAFTGRQLDLDASARRQEIHENELRDMISDGRAMDARLHSLVFLVSCKLLAGMHCMKRPKQPCAKS